MRITKRDIEQRKRGNGYIHISTSGTTRNRIGSRAPKDMVICVGFGSAAVYCNGIRVLDGERAPRKHCDGNGYLRLKHAEKLARKARRAKWEVDMQAPLWSATWRRNKRGQWICVDAGMGFA